MNKTLKSNQEKGQRGQSLTEYILIITLIAIACIAAVKIFGEDIKNAFSNASAEVREATKQSSK